MDSTDDQDAVLGLNLARNLSRQPPVAGIDVARLQRTSKGTEHSTSSGCDDIIDGRSVGFGQGRRIHFVVLRDGAVHAENYRLRLARNMGDAKRSFLAFNP